MYYAATYPILNHVASSAFGFITCRRFHVAVKRTSHARVHRQSASANGNARHISRWYICMPTHAPSPSSACSANALPKNLLKQKKNCRRHFRARGIRKKRVLLTFERRREDGSFTFLYFWLRHVHLTAQFIDPQKQTERQSAKLFQSIVRKIYSPFPVWVIGGVSWKSLYLSDDKGGFGDILLGFSLSVAMLLFIAWGIFLASSGTLAFHSSNFSVFYCEKTKINFSPIWCNFGT